MCNGKIDVPPEAAEEAEPLLSIQQTMAKNLLQ